MSTELDTSSERWVRDEIFSAAWAYDLAFGWSIAAEVELLSSLAGLQRGMRVLLPACGTGRFALALAERGCTVDAFDINPHMLDFASRHRAHANTSYRVADMAQPLGDARDVAAAFALCNSFRYLLDEHDALRNLEFVERRLVGGGIYVLELALNVDDPAELGVEQRWEIDYGNVRVRASWTLTELSAPSSMELARIQVETADGRHAEFQAHQPQRLWSWPELERAARAARFEIAGLFLPNGAPVDQAHTPGRYYVALRARNEKA